MAHTFPDEPVAGLSLPQRAHEAAGWVDAGILDLKRALGYLTDSAAVEELEKFVVGCTLLRERVRSTPRLCARIEPKEKSGESVEESSR